jgi:hypothetical protein
VSYETEYEISGSHGDDYEDDYWDLSRVILYKFTDVSEELIASVIRAVSAEGSKHLRNFGQFLPCYTS